MLLFAVARNALAVIALLLFAGVPLSVSATPTSQRSDFLEAEQALNRGDMTQFEELKARLAGYPLLPYLEYQELLKKLRQLDQSEAKHFLLRHQGTPVADKFLRIYLLTLGEQHKWNQFLTFYQPTDSDQLHCFELQALIQTGKTKIAFDAVAPLWLNAKSMPGECDPVFDAWRKAGRLTQSLVWQRIDLAMEQRNTGLAKYLGRFLSEADRSWLDLWLEVDGEPTRIEGRQTFLAKHGKRNDILLHGFKRLARLSPDRAEATWRVLTKTYGFTEDQAYQAERALVLAWMHRDTPGALEKIDAFSVRPDDHRIHEARIREALANRAWQQALVWIDALPPALKSKENWRYWRARTLLETGNTVQANALFQSLAKERSYHGFLAADRIGSPYNLDNTPLTVPAAQIEAVASRSAFQRSGELLALGRLIDARREWYAEIKNLSVPELHAAAKLAQRWGWHPQAIFTQARTGYWDDLELRFPLEHEQHVDAASSAKHLDKAWVLAVIRQESAFSVDAESHAGALGLMQLMPATARGTAKAMNRKVPKRDDLLTPATNIDIGTSYLKKVYERLNDNPVLAISAYNAGPHRVLKWLPEKALEADLWVETIPFSETRRYTERVLEYSVIYDERLGNRVTQIKERMPMILPDNFKIRNASL